MMSDELRQAAERILRDTWCNTAGYPKHWSIQAVNALAMIHLAEHPADGDEAIDEAGFRSMGATTLAVGLGVRTSVGNTCVILNEDSQICIVQEDEDTFIDEMVSLPQIRTFHQLRRLLAALEAK